MASNAGSRHRAVVHLFYGEGRCAAVAQGAFIPRHSSRSCRRYVVARLRCNPCVRSTVAGLACPCCDTTMVECSRQPHGKTMVTGFTSCGSRQMAGRLDVYVGVSAAMTIAATRGGNAGMRIRRNQRQPGKPGSMAGITRL